MTFLDLDAIEDVHGRHLISIGEAGFLFILQFSQIFQLIEVLSFTIFTLGEPTLFVSIRFKFTISKCNCIPSFPWANTDPLHIQSSALLCAPIPEYKVKNPRRFLAYTPRVMLPLRLTVIQHQHSIPTSLWLIILHHSVGLRTGELAERDPNSQS